jgi:hypothetical protein
MIDRRRELETLQGLIKRNPVVGIVGARQVGKTTLAHALAPIIGTATSYFDLENPEDVAQLADPMMALKERRGLVVIDEIQRYPDLYPVLRVLVDRPRSVARFLVLGSASPEMLRQSSESLAGRIVYHELGGFALDEVGVKERVKLWLRGGFPRSYLSRSLGQSDEWRRGFIKTFLERDLPQLGINIRSVTLQRFWTMLAHYHGQVFNASELGRSFGVADTTVRNYLDLLSAAMVVRQLPPWHENISKRQVKGPKVYLADTGLLHSLLNLKTLRDLEGHPKVGASWEGFVMEAVMRHLGARREECFFWATHAGAELDLFVIRGKRRIGIEIKRTSSPKITPSMRSAVADLGLQQMYVIHAGEHTFDLQRRVRAVAFVRFQEDLSPLA